MSAPGRLRPLRRWFPKSGARVVRSLQRLSITGLRWSNLNYKWNCILSLEHLDQTFKQGAHQPCADSGGCVALACTL